MCACQKDVFFQIYLAEVQSPNPWMLDLLRRWSHYSEAFPKLFLNGSPQQWQQDCKKVLPAIATDFKLKVADSLLNFPKIVFVCDQQVFQGTFFPAYKGETPENLSSVACPCCERSSNGGEMLRLFLYFYNNFTRVISTLPGLLQP